MKKSERGWSPGETEECLKTIVQKKERSSQSGKQYHILRLGRV